MANLKRQEHPATIKIKGCKAQGKDGECTLKWCRDARGDWCGNCKWRFT